jgi:hypothetical protein
MKPEEFKVGQKIKYTGNIIPKEKNITQTVLTIEDLVIYTDLTKFDMSSDYAKLCILLYESRTFTAQEMIEFAGWYSADVDETCLKSYIDMLKQRQEQEYQLYLTLKAKYEC